MKKLINLTGQASPHLSRKITYLMMLLVSLIWSTGTAWAEEVVLKTIDFTSAEWTGKTFSQGDSKTADVINGITFYSSSAGNQFSIVAEAGETPQHLQGSSNMSTTNYFIAIPVSGINGSVTITVVGEAKSTFRYSVDNSTATVPTSNTATTAKDQTSGISYVTKETSNTDATIFVGLQSSSYKKIYSITITTPAPLPTAASIKSVDGTTTTWNFGGLTTDHLDYMKSLSPAWEAEGDKAVKIPTVSQATYWSPSWCEGIQIGANQSANGDKIRLYASDGKYPGFWLGGGAASMKVTIPAGANTLTVTSMTGVEGKDQNSNKITFAYTADNTYTAKVNEGDVIEIVRISGQGSNSISQVITSYVTPVSYTVSFDVDSKGGDVTAIPEVSEGAGITLPKVTPIPDHTFLGWDSNNDGKADLYAGDLYHPIANITLKAVYSAESATVGTANSPFWSAFSKFCQLQKDNSIGFTFTNKGGNDNTFENWVMIVTNNNEGHALDGNPNVGSNELYCLRPDGGAWGTGFDNSGRASQLYKDNAGHYDPVTNIDDNAEKTAFINAMKNATVDLSISYEDQYIYTIAKITSANGNYILVDKSASIGEEESVWVSFTTEKATITFTSEKTNQPSVKVVTAHTGGGATAAKIAPGIPLSPERPIANGTEVVFQATPDAGATLINWTDAGSNEVSTETDFTKAITENVTYTANFAKDLKDFRSGGRQDTKFYVGQSELAHNLVLTFNDGEAIPIVESDFTLESSNPEVATVAWRSNTPSIKFNALTAGSTTITVTYHADGFKTRVVEIPLTVAAPCVVTFATEGETKGTVSATGPKNVTNFDKNTGALTSGKTIPAGTVVKFIATPADGYEFDGWYSGEDLVSPDAIYTTTINANVNLVAKFKTPSLPSAKWIFDEESTQGTYTDEGLDLVITGSASWNTGHSLAGLKLNGETTTITFTPNADGVLKVNGTVFNNNSPLLVVTQNGNTLDCNEAQKTGTEITYNVTAGKTVTIVRANSNGSSLRITEIEFTPTGAIVEQLVAPTISVEGNVVTFTNPNEGSTLYYKVDRTKDGNVSGTYNDSSTTEATYQVILPYGVYPANWIQAVVNNATQTSEITKYAENVTVAPETPAFTKTADAINFTAPTGCYLEFHVGSASAEAIIVNSATTTVSVDKSANKMTINGTQYDKANLFVKSVAEYDMPNSEKGKVASEAVEVTTDVTNVATVIIPATLDVYVGQTKSLELSATWIDESGSKDTGSLTKRWVITSGSDNISLARNINTRSEITGKKSNTSDNATATVKVTVDGVESNVCTITIKRTPLAVRADHIALSHNSSDARTPHAIAYNPYTRAVVGGESIKNSVLTTNNLTITAAPKSGSSAFANFADGTFTAKNNTATGSETWVVTVAPKTTADKDLYTSGTAEIEVTCRDYLYAYSATKPATTPTARPVTNAENEVALNYYAGHNPANCRLAEGDEPLKVWGDKNRAPQEQVLANYSKTNDATQRPFGRIHGWDGIKNVAEPTMNSLSEQHTTTNKYGGDSNGKFTYKAYNYSGTHDEFNVPVMGSFYRFYPEKNGTLVAYLCVNGQFSDTDMERLANDNTTQTGYASRNTYFLDPYANSMKIKNATVQPTSTIQTGFFYYTRENCKNAANLTRDIEALLNNWAKWGNDEKDANGNLVIPVMSTSYAAGKTTYTIDDLDKDKFKALAQDKVGIFHQPIPNDDGSFRVIFKTYVRCEIPVEKGRVYYVSPTGTKTRMAGVEFIPANDDPVAENVKFYNGTMTTPKGDTAPYVVATGKNNFMNEANNGKYYNVTIADRVFKAGQWYSFCMPFDVPQKQIHDIFGEGAVTIHFDNVKEEGGTLKMNFWSHFYDQIRAGRPIMIKMPETFPDGSTELGNEKVTFKHVKLNMVNPEELYITDGKWTFKGSYTPVTMEKNAVIINGTQFYHYKNTAKTLAGNRAWIQGPADGNSQGLKTAIFMFNDDDDDTATGIEEVLSEMGINVMKSSNKIFNLNGQMVGEGADINNLPKGVYIINGKKQIIK